MGRFFLCNICGNPCKARISDLQREVPSCPKCSWTVRYRAIVHILSTELFGESMVLKDFPVRPDLIGIGMSDWIGYATLLKKKLSYTNTFLHRKPELDIRSIAPSLEGRFDFIISTEVFEHIAPPVSLAFQNIRKLLKPTGVLIFSVPYIKNGRTEEHFPNLYQYEIVKTAGQTLLRNRTKTGNEEVFRDLIFHGNTDRGSGIALEVRIFSEASLFEEFEKAGFSNIKVYKEPHFEYGIYFGYDWSLPIALRLT